jgi:hypothetical protein
MTEEKMNEIVLSRPHERARGVIGRYPAPDERYVFEYDGVASRRIHMIGVRRPLRVTWWIGDEAVAVETLRPWIGTAAHRADRVTEEAAGDQEGFGDADR